MVSGKRTWSVKELLTVAFVLALAAMAGWLVARVDLLLTLQVAGALILPAVLLVGIVLVRSNKGLSTLLTLTLYALAAAGTWWLIGRWG